MQTKTIDLIDNKHWNLYISFQTFIGIGFNINFTQGFSFTIILPIIVVGIIYTK